MRESLEDYYEYWQGKSYEELKAERDELIELIHKCEEGWTPGVSGGVDSKGDPYVTIISSAPTYDDYMNELAVICNLMTNNIAVDIQTEEGRKRLYDRLTVEAKKLIEEMQSGD